MFWEGTVIRSEVPDYCIDFFYGVSGPVTRSCAGVDAAASQDEGLLSKAKPKVLVVEILKIY